MPPQPRRPAGRPTGGQFASIRRPDPESLGLVDETMLTSPELVRARRVLIEGLKALAPQREAITLIGAQAVYEHTAALSSVSPTLTTDGDTCIAPQHVVAGFDIGQALTDAGFTAHPDRPGIWTIELDGDRVALDLLVPEALAGPGRRGARVAGQDRRAIGRAAGLELVVVDRELRALAALDDSSDAVDAYVAGPAALLCAKAYKIAERLAELRQRGHDRVREKDAGDAWRLMAVSDPRAVSKTFADAANDHVIGSAVALGRRYLTELFAPEGDGLALAVHDLRRYIDEHRITDVVESFMEGFRAGSPGT